MKSNKLARLLALLLAVAMCISMAACNTEKPQETKDNKPAETKPNTGDNTPATEGPKNYWEMLDEVTDSSELPDWTGEKLELTVWFAAGTDTIFGEISDTNVTFKEIERVTGVVINVEDSITNGGDNIDAKLPKLLATGDFPSIIYGYHIDEQMNALYENGYLYDLSEYYENGTLDHLQHWLPVDTMEELLYSHLRGEDGSLFLLPAGINAQVLHDNTGYTVPEIDLDYYNIYGAAPSNKFGAVSTTCLYIRDDVLQAVRPGAMSAAEIKDIYLQNGTFTEEQIYDLDLNSTEDFVQLLRDIQAELATGKYVGLDGTPMEVTYGPNSESDNWGWMVQLNPLISGYQNDYFSILTQENAKNGTMYEWGFQNKVVVDHMKLLNGLVREDIISQNSVVDNGAVFGEKINNGHYAVTYGRNAAAIGEGQANWGYRPVWVNLPNNKAFGYTGKGSTVSYYGVFKNSVPEDQLDQLMHYVDYINSEVGMNVMFYGPASAGLFTVDANGNRVYTDPELEANMLYKEDNGANVKYGLMNMDVSERTFNDCFMCGVSDSLFKPSYLMKSTFERLPSDAFVYFNPGILPGQAYNDTAIPIVVNYPIYSTAMSNVDAIAEFWTARAGFENQMKKVIVAESDAEFDAQLQALVDYAEEFGLTDETLKAYNAFMIEQNYEEYKAAGFKID